jgi:type I restriction enzyme, R subunit
MGLNESDTRAKLLDPAVHTCGWTEDLIRREATAGAIEITDGKPRKRAKGRVDYTLRIKVNLDTQPVAVELIEPRPNISHRRTGLSKPSCMPPASD